MRDGIRAEIAARVALTIAALLPYWRLLTFSAVFVTDDYFTSDIFNGELPARVLIGRLIRDGQLPVWTGQLCSGLPLAGAPLDPIGVAAFTWLSPAAALDLLVVVLLLIAAHGAYSLARRFGSDRWGALLAGIAFAGSGYIACQLKHLAIVATVVWLPVGLVLIDRVFVHSAATLARRSVLVAGFGLVLAVQALSGFPQSLYICLLVYGVFAVFRAITLSRQAGHPGTAVSALALLGFGTALGLGAGAVVLVPLARLGAISDRADVLNWVWVSRWAYWPLDVATFLVPYAFGDISANTYTGTGLFWEDYGYIGAAPFLLGVFFGILERRRPFVSFTIAMTLVAYLLVLGPATPFFRIAYELVPGMKLFRFPTRFLIVVELGLALLGAIGLTRLLAEVKHLSKGEPRLAPAIGLLICTFTAADLLIHQPRLNPMVSAREWLAAPSTVEVVGSDNSHPRTFTPQHRNLHRRTFYTAHGWADLAPYFQLREVLEPNTGGGFWNVPSADCYAGIAARWYVETWGSVDREDSLVSPLSLVEFNRRVLRIDPKLVPILQLYGVTHLLSLYPVEGAPLNLVRSTANSYIYRIDGAARVRFVRAARRVNEEGEAARRLLDADFDGNRELLLHDAPADVHPTLNEVTDSQPLALPAHAGVKSEDSEGLTIEIDAPADGFLLLADTYYPGWRADVDGTPAPIYRANISVRAVPLIKGRHQVRFTYDPPGVRLGVWTTLVAGSLLLLWLAAAGVYLSRSARR